MTIKLQAINKSFIVSGRSRRPLYRELINWRSRPRREGATEVLKNIHLEIPDGSRVAVIGRNGAGKSTLLRLIAGIYKPNSGEVKVDGRLCCFLEPGAGAASALPVRDNVFLYASLAGLGYRETKECLPRILEFCSFSGQEFTIISLPGTFAHGKLDKGTSLLLDVLDELKPSGSVLDFACGNGVVGLSLLSLHPVARLSLLDVSAIALESTRRSLAANDMEATVVASDGLSGLEGNFDWIISNPPFHRGIKNDLEIARKFFANAGNFLTETGKILLVCNHHLPYPAWLKEYFTRVEVVRHNREFKVILASGPLA